MKISFKKKILLTFRERGREREEGEGEIEIEKYGLAVFGTPPTGDLAQNAIVCPDWEMNRQPLGFQAWAQSTEPPQPGLLLTFSSTDQYIRTLFYVVMFEGILFNIPWIHPHGAHSQRHWARA